MDPDVIKDTPGKCPKCGMDLTRIQNSEFRVQKKNNEDQYHKHPTNHEDHHTLMEEDFKKRFFTTLPFVLFVMLLSPNIQKWLSFSLVFPGKEVTVFILGTFIFVFGGIPFFKAARGEISSRNFGMMTLVSLAVIVGYTFSVAATFIFPGESLYWEISTLISVFLFGHWLEMRAVRGATGAIAELAKLIPQNSHLLKGKNIIDVLTESLVKGDRVLVKPGEKIPADGKVIGGESSVNESMITGESNPVSKNRGNAVIGGAINNEGSLIVEVTKTGKESAIAQIMELIRQAQQSKPSVQLVADRGAFVLTVTAVLVGVITFVFWQFISPQGAIFATTLAVSVIVVACPHALGLAIPTVTTITSALGARNGILIKNMKAFEILRKVNFVIFDKTGTLTKGEFGVTNVILRTRPEESRSFTFAQDDILRIAAAIETHSQHPIAKGIIEEAKKKKIKIPSISSFKSYPGKGASSKIENKEVAVGNEKILDSFGIKAPNLKESKGSTLVYVFVNNKLLGTIALSDIIREESKKAIDALHKMGIKVAMLTGDREDVASAVSRKLNIDKYFAQVLPQDKINKIKELQRQKNIVAMVGDGVNDAPSLTQAHIGIAIGAGTDVAMQSSDIILVKNNPQDVVKAINLSRKTNSKMVQNLIWATGYNIIAIPIAAGLFYKSLDILLRPQWAAILMSLSSIIVVFNALLLRRAKLSG